MREPNTPQDDDMILWSERQDAIERAVARIRFNPKPQDPRYTRLTGWEAQCSACRARFAVDKWPEFNWLLSHHRDEHRRQWARADEHDLPADFWDGITRHRDAAGLPLARGHRVWQVSAEHGLPVRTLGRQWLITWEKRSTLEVMPAWKAAADVGWSELRRSRGEGLSRIDPANADQLQAADLQLGLFG